MILIDTVDIVLALLAGALLGVFFFAGLWWTVRQLGSSQHVALLFLFSMLFRTGVVIFGFYLILGDNWQRLLAGLIGFFIIRLITMQYFNRRVQYLSTGQKSGYAP